MQELLYGRRLLTCELQQLGVSAAQSAQLPSEAAMVVRGQQVQCQRCGSVYPQKTVQLPGAFYYCPSCLQMGRVTSNQRLYHLPEPNAFAPQSQAMTWSGQLTEDQANIAKALIDSFNKHRQHLLWAVTGAGKTEMLFPLLAEAIESSARVALASPRVDVCIELFPRIQRAFANTSIQICHGAQTAPYQYCQLNIVTTHQLLRFYHAFDLLIIDEVDAFPFVNNAMLAYGVQNAVKPQGALFYLTATPTPELLAAQAKKQLTTSYLPRRFHGRPLPLPSLHYQHDLKQRLAAGKLPPKFEALLQQSRRKKRQILVFVAKIELLRPLVSLLKQHFKMHMDGVHAADPLRGEKVQAFRAHQLDMLLTTTILERGVTFANIDVYVLQADDRVFNTSSLVQIAGRAGRSPNYPNGSVCFFYEYYTEAIKGCQRQIGFMNRKGGF